MQEASFQGFFRTILIIIIFYYVFKLIGRLLFPIFFKKMVSKFESQMKQQGFDQKKEDIKVGETTIERKPTFREPEKHIGEYVDFEEIKKE
jgi:hypothetical protein